MSDTPRTDLIENEALADYKYCELSFNYMKEHAQDLERENAKLKAHNAELFAALQRLLRAIEADVEQCPQMDVLTAFETNSMAIQQAREAIAKYKPA